MTARFTRGARALALLASASLLAAACTDDSGTDNSGSTGAVDSAGTSSDVVENRLAVAFENGVAVLDGETLEVVEEFDSEEFIRLNSVGDGRTVLVTVSDGFQVLDLAEPALTDLVFEAETPAHVVPHAGKTVLYDDGTSNSYIFDTSAMSESVGELPEVETIPGDTAHHGVSLVLSDGTFLTTIGDDEGRSGARAVDPDGEEITRNEECPGIHGEGTAADETVVFGCEDGALVYHHGEFEKLTAADDYGRMGNAYVTESSSLVVGDYQDDPDAEGVLLDKVALIDTGAHTLDVVELPEGVEYTWRGVVRGPDDLAYILATDGSVYVLDPATGEIAESFDVVGPWDAPVEWQDPHPGMVAHGDIAYVSEPAENTVHAVDLRTGETIASGQTSGAPNEMAVAGA